jgi:hypothetical protein
MLKFLSNFLSSLNKIGKNPHLVSDRENLESDCQTMNAIVNALSAGRSPCGSTESLGGENSHHHHHQADFQHFYLSLIVLLKCPKSPTEMSQKSY